MTTTRWRALLLAAVAACAACGLIYELALLTLSTSLHGGGIVATSLIVAGFVAALGAGVGGSFNAITVDSEPGATVFEVRLPARPETPTS